MAKNEKTSPRIARIAAKILKVPVKRGTVELAFEHKDYGWCTNLLGISWTEIRSLAASALTQTKDKTRGK